MNSGEAISGTEDVPGDTPKEESEMTDAGSDPVPNPASDPVPDTAVEEEIQAGNQPVQEPKAAPLHSQGEVESLIAGKVRSLGKPRSG